MKTFPILTIKEALAMLERGALAKGKSRINKFLSIKGACGIIRSAVETSPVDPIPEWLAIRVMQVSQNRKRIQLADIPKTLSD